MKMNQNTNREAKRSVRAYGITLRIFEVLQDEKVQDETGQESVVAECPHEDLMAEAEEEGFSNYRVVNRHFQLNTQASTSPSPKMPPKALRILQISHRRPRTMAETPKGNRCLTSAKLGVLVRKLV
ncbi:hypothetical protein PROFUN_13323 [Planoprotostelium fungivorum]|uniref:Uncharacterized protein n=1 Tax=Planoprotostelium fungivorum TaxID=1890364 RepID=A0A2P6N453_9EUKA|nr:hypothetical protein PROFUN_13323 [Planoprotostelium fungivorum]